MAFRPGQGGRPKGAKNHSKDGPLKPRAVRKNATDRVETLCGRLVNHPTYQRGLKARMLAGKLPPAVETMIWAYWAGRPVERVAVEGVRVPLFLLAAGDEVKTS